MPYKRYSDLFEIAWDFDSTKHYDDFMSVSEINDFLVLVMADGVSQSWCGRVASVYATKYAIDFLKEHKDQIKSGISSDDLERLIKDSIYYAGERIRKIGDAIKPYILVKKAEKEYETLEKVRAYIKEITSRYSRDIERIMESVTSIYTFCDEVKKQVSLVLDEKNVNKFMQKVKELEKANSQLRDMVNRMNSIIEEKIKDLSRSKFKIYIQEKESFLNILKQLKASITMLKIDNYTNSNLTAFSLPSISDTFQKIGISQDEYKRSETSLKALIEEIVKMRNKKREDKKALEQSLLSRIVEFQLPAFTSTLTIFIANYKKPSKIYIAVLGDSDINMINTKTFEWTSLYSTATSGGLTNYISSEKGVAGSPHIFNTTIEQKNVLIILSTDGANISYTSPGGVPGAPFINKIKTATREKGTIEGFPEQWIDYLRERNGSDDDISLFIASIKQEENPTV